MSKASTTVAVSSQSLGKLRPEKSLNYHQQASITSLDFNDAGQFLISAGVDRSIQLYDVHKGVHVKLIQSQKYGAHLARFTHADFACLYASTPDLESDVDHSIRHLSLADKQYIRYFKGHKQQVLNLEVHPVKDLFLSSSVDKTVKLWDTRASTPAGNIDVGQPSLVAYDPYGVVFAVGKYGNPKSLALEGQLALYDTKSFDKRPFLTVLVPLIPNATWTKLEFSNNGKLILISTDAQEDYVVDAFTGKLLCVLQMTSTPYSHEHYTENWMTYKYPSSGRSCFSPCGKFVLAGSPKMSVLVFDLAAIKSSDGSNDFTQVSPTKLKPVHVLKTDHGLPKIVTFNPKLLSIATADNSVALWKGDD